MGDLLDFIKPIANHAPLKPPKVAWLHKMSISFITVISPKPETL